MSKKHSPAAVPVSRLLCGLQDRTAGPDSANYVLKVSNAPGEAVDASDHQDVAGV
jgi:hypothetical protein